MDTKMDFSYKLNFIHIILFYIYYFNYIPFIFLIILQVFSFIIIL